jgi:hypothetical protein
MRKGRRLRRARRDASAKEAYMSQMAAGMRGIMCSTCRIAQGLPGGEITCRCGAHLGRVALRGAALAWAVRQ